MKQHHHHPSARSAAAAPWRTALVALATLAAASALVGCDSTPTARRAGSDTTPTQGQSGITVYGTVDAGVSRSR